QADAHIAAGLEDNLFVGKGQLATNAELVEKAVQVIEGMGARIIGPEEVRKKLKLTKR
ncbi:3-keto-5-aminohexanoate cleavage protein, partial [Rhizobium johnstonii]|uniref:3-keto-5-aminohexanoate cleavage protein n=1 Tax=Rhizobium johnstonii TaxID=3019933 RepID=UPI003F95A68C